MSAQILHEVRALFNEIKHTGTALVEIDQNCVIFNDGAFSYATDKDQKAETVVYLEHGKPLIFGKDHQKGIALNNRLQPRIVNLSDTQPADLLIYDEQEPVSAVSFLLSNLPQPDFPDPMGVFRAVEQDPFDALVHTQIAQARSQRGNPDLQTMLDGSESWTVQ